MFGLISIKVTDAKPFTKTWSWNGTVRYVGAEGVDER